MEHRRMNSKVRDLWTEALRSGRYLQGRGELERVGEDGKGRFCCLGVLTALAVEAGVVGLTRHVDDHGETFFWQEGDVSRQETGVLLPAVVEWAGLWSEDPLLGELTAIECNDTVGMSFTEIAGRIEKNL